MLLAVLLVGPSLGVTDNQIAGVGVRVPMPMLAEDVMILINCRTSSRSLLKAERCCCCAATKSGQSLHKLARPLVNDGNSVDVSYLVQHQLP